MIQTTQDTVKNIAHFIYYEHTPSQLLIDIVEEAEELVDVEHTYREVIGSFCYKLSIIIDVFNPNLEIDLSKLKELYQVFHDELKILEGKQNTKISQ